MKRYRASGIVPEGSLPILVASVLGSAVVLSAVHYLITRYFDLVLLFYFAIGGGIGYVAHRFIQTRRIRAPLLAAALAVSGAATAWLLSEIVVPLAVHWQDNKEFVASLAQELGTTESEAFRQMLVGELAKAGDPASLAREPADVPSWIETGVGYINLRARLGITVIHHGNANKEGFGMSLALMLSELLFCCWVAGGIAFEAANTPYCEQCGQWYSAPQGHWQAGKSKAWASVVGAIESGDVEKLAQHAADARDEQRDVLWLDASRCPQCQISPVHIRLALRNRRWSLRYGRRSGLISIDAAARLVSALSGTASRTP